MTIFDYTIKLLADLKQNSKIDFVDKYKKIARTGKLVRIKKYLLDIPVQSLYDHILTLGYNADIFNNLYDFDLNEEIFAQIVVFHDIAEVFMGDIPYFTNKELAGQNYIPQLDKDHVEMEVNNLILDNLGDSHKEMYLKSRNFLDKGSNTSDLFKLFRFTDKTEPIISIYRYIYLHKDNININIFLEAMNDFFQNPDVITKALDDESRDLIVFLQSKDSAREYFEKGNMCFDKTDLNIKSEVFLQLIEKNPMHYVIDPF